MKKKEMIKILKKAMKQFEDCKITLLDAAIVLDQLEKAGMKPPLVKIQGVFGDDWQNVWEEEK
jgi:hypothetical protein